MYQVFVSFKDGSHDHKCFNTDEAFEAYLSEVKEEGTIFQTACAERVKERSDSFFEEGSNGTWISAKYFKGALFLNEEGANAAREVSYDIREQGEEEFLEYESSTFLNALLLEIAIEGEVIVSEYVGDALKAIDKDDLDITDLSIAPWEHASNISNKYIVKKN